MKYFATIILAAALSGCGERAAEPAAQAEAQAAQSDATQAIASNLTGFTSDRVERFGYYMPTREIMTGTWRLDHLHLGGPDEFTKFEGGERIETYSPVLLDFSDTASETAVNELGDTYHVVQDCALATAYRVQNDEVRFLGTAKTLGAVRFEGVFDPLAYAEAYSDKPDAIVLRGRLSIGNEIYEDVAFTWYSGE